MRRFYGCLAIAFAVYTVLVASSFERAEAQSSEAVRQLERRMDAVDAQKLGERMARQEALMETLTKQGETTNKLLLGVFGTLALMLAERAVRGGPARMKRRQLGLFGESDE